MQKSWRSNNSKCNNIIVLIDYIGYVFHSWYKVQTLEETCRGPIAQHPGLGTSLQNKFENKTCWIMQSNLQLSVRIRAHDLWPGRQREAFSIARN